MFGHCEAPIDSLTLQKGSQPTRLFYHSNNKQDIKNSVCNPETGVKSDW